MSHSLTLKLFEVKFYIMTKFNNFSMLHIEHKNLSDYWLAVGFRQYTSQLLVNVTNFYFNLFSQILILCLCSFMWFYSFKLQLRGMWKPALILWQPYSQSQATPFLFTLFLHIIVSVWTEVSYQQSESRNIHIT